ncbi:hypothetical protein [Micromonospora halophytica]|uniref:PH domain-containing protein n=1 Tax=Micromonospora halophytica TaxID=47864 RepID=A0A1C5H406_9ACTN|nr:hypothetical protein [Micromonospora halophytica]SCG40776.1 hypothetical protein GA0070560_10358 [Micromonospora halophytica]
MPSRRSLRAPPLGDGLWSRRLLSLTLAVGVTAAVAAPLLRVTRFDVGGAACGLWLMIGAQQLARRWWPRRDARLTWRLRVAGRDAVEPGLVARRSLAGWADRVADLVWITPAWLTGLSLLPTDARWAEVARVALICGFAAWLGRAAYEEARFTGRLALTASGIRYGRRLYDWTNIDRVAPHKRDGRINGVRLRPVRWLSLEPAPVVGGRDTAVPEERLIAAIEHYRSRPEVLGMGLPVTAPEPAPAAGTEPTTAPTTGR